MKQTLLTLVMGMLFLNFCIGQKRTMKPLAELIEKQQPAWDVIKEWETSATNQVEILPRDNTRADSALYQCQLPTSTPMVAVVYNCGGILVNNGLVRILGSGCSRLNRSLPEWNKGKSFTSFEETPSFLLVADDAIGGFFAVNTGGIDAHRDINKIFYYGPNSLKWQSTGLTYSDFIVFCFSRSLEKFYEDFRWNGWEEDMKKIDRNEVVSCYPLLWTREALQLPVNRKTRSVQAQWDMYNNHKKPASKKKSTKVLAER